MIKFIVITALAVGLSSGVDIGFRSKERLAFGDKNPIFSGRITAGQEAKEGEFPHQIGLRENKTQICGGVIISENVVLTAAHCILSGKDKPSMYEVVAGFINQTKPGPNIQSSPVKKIFSHPSYPGRVGPNDIAVLILQTPFKWNRYVQKVELPPAGKEFEGDTWISGWGSVSTNIFPQYPEVLQKAKVPIISFKDCSAYYSFADLDEKSNLCTGPLRGNISACSGDSGGPLVKEVDGVKYVVGLVSWGQIPCGHGSPTVFTKVSNFIKFIKDNSK